MKIITGSLKGRNLITPEGLDTRPTGSRVKESIFNIVQFDIEGRAVLDLFAGSGQLGFEAISRGAASCTFCEIDRKAFAVLQKNLEYCKVDNGHLFNRDGLTYLRTATPKSAGLVFLDPPYESKLLNDAILAIIEFDILQDGGIIVCESDRDYVIAQLPDSHQILKEYVYGKSKITTITKSGD